MKKLTIAALLIAGFYVAANAQSIAKPVKPDSLSTKEKINLLTNSVFLEILGNGVYYSFNYERRFSGKYAGPGVRAGFSLIDIKNGSGNHIKETTIFTIPIGGNVLIGDRGYYFEIGAGITFNLSNQDLHMFNARIKEYDKVVGFLTFGYRYQNPKGFQFRLAITPVIGENVGLFNPIHGGISFGAAF